MKDYYMILIAVRSAPYKSRKINNGFTNAQSITMSTRTRFFTLKNLTILASKMIHFMRYLNF